MGKIRLPHHHAGNKGAQGQRQSEEGRGVSSPQSHKRHRQNEQLSVAKLGHPLKHPGENHGSQRTGHTEEERRLSDRPHYVVRHFAARTRPVSYTHLTLPTIYSV